MPPRHAAAPNSTLSADRCWVLSDGKPGNENPCLGLAEAAGFDAVVKRIVTRPPWSLLPPALWLAPFAALTPAGDRLAPPWPAVLIACGRQSVAPARAVGAASGGRCFTVQLLDPGVDPAGFDMVVAPAHDGLDGSNVMTTLGALNRITPERLALAAEALRPTVEHLPSPRIAVLIGGANKRMRMSRGDAVTLAKRLADVAAENGAGLMVTTSRRTGAANQEILRRQLSGTPAVIWDGDGDNPYFGYLGLADAIVVTSDSVAMASEAAATGKPVYIYALPGGSAKFSRFHADLRAAGCARPFDGGLESWRYAPLAETARVAAALRRRLGIE